MRYCTSASNDQGYTLEIKTKVSRSLRSFIAHSATCRVDGVNPTASPAKLIKGLSQTHHHRTYTLLRRGLRKSTKPYSIRAWTTLRGQDRLPKLGLILVFSRYSVGSYSDAIIDRWSKISTKCLVAVLRQNPHIKAMCGLIDHIK